MKPFCFLILLIGAVAASDTDGLITGALKFVKDCNDKPITLCVKVRKRAEKNKTKKKLSHEKLCANKIVKRIKFLMDNLPSITACLSKLVQCISSWQTFMW